MKKHFSLTAFFLAVLLFAGCAAPANKESVRGAIEGNVYTSKFAGISFDAPEGWVYASEDDLKQMMASQLSKYGEQVSDDLLKNRIIYDMVVKNPSNGSVVAVSYQNLELLAGQYNTDAELFTEDDLLDSVKMILAESPQYGSVTGDISDMKLGSTSFRSLSHFSLTIVPICLKLYIYYNSTSAVNFNNVWGIRYEKKSDCYSSSITYRGNACRMRRARAGSRHYKG